MRYMRWGGRAKRWSWQGESHIYKTEDKRRTDWSALFLVFSEGKRTANEQIHSPTPDSAAGRASQVAKATSAEHKMETSVCTHGHGQRRLCPKHLPVHRGTPKGGGAHFRVAPSRKPERRWRPVLQWRILKPMNLENELPSPSLNLIRYHSVLLTSGLSFSFWFSCLFVCVYLFVCFKKSNSTELKPPSHSSSIRRPFLFFLEDTALPNFFTSFSCFHNFGTYLLPWTM